MRIHNIHIFREIRKILTSDRPMIIVKLLTVDKKKQTKKTHTHTLQSVQPLVIVLHYENTPIQIH